jgi:catechol 2,3-dioxygenase-like lactoylglutathione lyase family enzyme
MCAQTINGLHHVTAICGDPKRNYAFYTGILGLRLVKKTVNFDDPGTYHLYYADGAGTPGSVLTFFPWPDMPRGRDGTGLVSATAFAASEAELPRWQDRLEEHGVKFRGPMQRFDEAYIEFEDPDGMRLEIVGADQAKAFQPWIGSPVPAEMQLRGFHSVTLVEAGYELTQALLTKHMGWTPLRQSGERFRYQAADGGPAALVDVICLPSAQRGRSGTGTVHHVAFRVDDDDAQLAWRQKLVGLGYNLSPVMDRNYFHSIYYREPGDILFEIATTPPGFAVDEPAETMGSALMLPAQFEPIRNQIEAHLPPLKDRHANP